MPASTIGKPVGHGTTARTSPGSVVGVDGDSVEASIEVLPRGTWVPVQHVGVEVAPGEFGGEGRVVGIGWIELGEQLSRMHDAELQVWREQTRAVTCGPVTPGRTGRGHRGETGPTCVHGRSVARCGVDGATTLGRVAGVASTHSGGGGGPVAPTQPIERHRRANGVKTVQGTHRAQDRPWLDRVRRTDTTKDTPLRWQGVSDSSVVAATVRPEFLRHEHGGGADLGSHARYNVDRVTASTTNASPVESFSVRSASPRYRRRGGTGRVERRVVDEQGQHLTLGTRSAQGRGDPRAADHAGTR